MARSLAQTLTRLTPISPSSLSSPTRFLNSRQRSTTPEKVAGAGKTDQHEEAEALKNLEDAIHRVVVKRSEPDWIRLAPGASYWVPPKSKASGFADVIEKLANNSNNPKKVKKEMAFSRSSNRGWPSSACYFKGASHSPLEGETTPKKTFKSEEEEG